MVSFMADVSKIDSQGRILIPAEIRRKLGFEPECKVGLIVIGNELVIKKVNTDLKLKVERWKQELMNRSIPVGVATEIETEDDKWMDKTYAERKLGLY